MMVVSMIGKYSFEALSTIEKIMGTTSYIVNGLYKNKEYNIYWFINKKGYMHILMPCNVRLDGKIIYFSIEDYLLTKDNMLKSKGHYGRYESVQAVVNKLEQMVYNTERRIIT